MAAKARRAGSSNASRNQPEVAAIGRVHMHPEAVPLAAAPGSRSSGSTAPIAVVPSVTTTVPTSPLRSSSPARPGPCVRGCRPGPQRYAQLEHARRCGCACSAPAPSPTSRLPGASCPATHSASRLAIVPLDVRWPRNSVQPNIRAISRDGLNLHLRAGPAAVARVVVGIDRHGQRIGCPRHRMRRLEHLPGIERMKVGIVVAQPVRDLVQHPGHRRRASARRLSQRPAAPANSACKRSVARDSRPGTGSCGHGDFLTVTQPQHAAISLIFQQVSEVEMRFVTGRRRLNSVLDSSEGCYTVLSVRAEPGVSSTRPTKQDSASGRSDSSSAIQSRKHEQNGTRYCEVVQ